MGTWRVSVTNCMLFTCPLAWGTLLVYWYHELKKYRSSPNRFQCDFANVSQDFSGAISPFTHRSFIFRVLHSLCMPPCRFDVIVTAQVFKRSDFPSGMINWHYFSLRDIETVRFVSGDWWLVWATISSKPPRDQCGEICDAYCFLDGNSIEGMVPDGRSVSTCIWFTLVHKCFQQNMLCGCISTWRCPWTVLAHYALSVTYMCDYTCFIHTYRTNTNHPRSTCIYR